MNGMWQVCKTRGPRKPKHPCIGATCVGIQCFVQNGGVIGVAREMDWWYGVWERRGGCARPDAQAPCGREAGGGATGGGGARGGGMGERGGCGGGGGDVGDEGDVRGQMHGRWCDLRNGGG